MQGSGWSLVQWTRVVELRGFASERSALSSQRLPRRCRLGVELVPKASALVFPLFYHDTAADVFGEDIKNVQTSGAYYLKHVKIGQGVDAPGLHDSASATSRLSTSSQRHCPLALSDRPTAVK